MKKDERIKKSYDFAADLSKQMITLSTAIITLCVAFTDKLFTSAVAQANSGWLLASLIVFVVSISLGVFHLMGLTGQLGKESTPETTSTTPAAQHEHEVAGMEVLPQANGQVQNNQRESENDDDVSIYSPTNRLTSLFQVLTFVSGLTLALFYIGRSIPSPPATSNQQKEVVDTTKCIKILRTSEYVIINGEKADTLYLLENK